MPCMPVITNQNRIVSNIKTPEASNKNATNCLILLTGIIFEAWPPRKLPNATPIEIETAICQSIKLFHAFPKVANIATGTCITCAKPIEVNVGIAKNERIGIKINGPPVPLKADKRPVTKPIKAYLL